MDIKQKLAPVLDKLELIRLDHLKPSPIAKAIVPPQAFAVAKDVLSSLGGEIDGDASFDVGFARSSVNLTVLGDGNHRRVYVDFLNGVSIKVRKVVTYTVSSSDACEFVVSHDIARAVASLVAWVATGKEGGL